MKYRATVYLTVMHILEVNADDSNEAEVEAMAIAELKGSVKELPRFTWIRFL